MVHFYELSKQESERRQRLILSRTEAAKRVARNKEAERWYLTIRFICRERRDFSKSTCAHWIEAYAAVFSEYYWNIKQLRQYLGEI